MITARQFLESVGLPGQDPADSPSSVQRFPDGGQYRIAMPDQRAHAVGA